MRAVFSDRCPNRNTLILRLSRFGKNAGNRQVSRLSVLESHIMTQYVSDKIQIVGISVAAVPTYFILGKLKLYKIPAFNFML